MINIKKIIFLIIKLALTLVVISTFILFFYSLFFYESPIVEKKDTKNQISQDEELLQFQPEENKTEETAAEKLADVVSESKKKIEKKITEDNTVKIETTIKDSLYATVGNKAITKSDIVNEIKIILILNNQRFTETNRDQLQAAATQSTVKRLIKQIEIEKYGDSLTFNKRDLQKELEQLAKNLNMDLDTLKNTFAANKINFEGISSQIQTELLWNSLIFELYKDRLIINEEEINEKLKTIENKKEIEEYLISEIIIKPVTSDKVESTIKELKDKIKAEGFENVAMNLSISETAARGGNLGWLNENVIADKIRSKIINTPVGNISEPIFLPEGILFFKVKNKRKVKKNTDLESLKNQLINSEKTKILNMFALSHYDNLRRSIAIKYY